jgi:hypothetical protein
MRKTHTTLTLILDRSHSTFLPPIYCSWQLCAIFAPRTVVYLFSCMSITLKTQVGKFELFIC